ncbi:beta-lactamase/transpeptidase-like protein [Podospora didyma]|uniref:Beta-lactamase/transpeptidase-like protein n=1 Tax=Podospora didyma TaxID=330526 RepID=A0AAE0U427_9PEZI|nr:beta-lactamase/transpeptidase-like protein [Podospora didyma]
MTSLPHRLDGLRPKIEELMLIAGVSGVSIGVYVEGKANYYANFGYRDVKEKFPITEQTILPICSLTKFFICIALGTIEDILSDRTGMSRGTRYLGSENNMLIAHKETLKFTRYELAGLIIDKVSRLPWSQVVAGIAIRPWGMQRTYTKHSPTSTPNASKEYNVLNEGTPTEIHPVQAGAGSFGGLSGGMFSCVEDLLKAYSTIMTGVNNRGGKQSAIKQLEELISARTRRLHANCSLPGAFSAVTMLPELRVAVVVMSNAQGLEDYADWIHQLVLEEVLDASPRNDYIAAAKTSASATLQWYPKTLEALEKMKSAGNSRPLAEYVGTYWNRKRYLKIDFSLAREGKTLS